MIIDYHSHLHWDRKTDTYDIEGLLMDMADNNIDIRVVSALNGSSITKQNDTIAKLVKEHPDKIIGCAVINPKAVDCVEEMQRIGELGIFKCIELDSLEHNYYPEECDAMDDIFELAEKYDLIVNVFTGWGPKTMPAQWAFFAEKHPNVKVVALHMGTTDFGYGTVELIPKMENMYLETSCMYELPILKKAFAVIDHSKFLFGSHYPHKFTKCSLETFDLLNLSEQFKKQLFYQNSKELLKL